MFIFFCTSCLQFVMTFALICSCSLLFQTPLHCLFEPTPLQWLLEPVSWQPSCHTVSPHTFYGPFVHRLGILCGLWEQTQLYSLSPHIYVLVQSSPKLLHRTLLKLSLVSLQNHLEGGAEFGDSRAVACAVADM